jgi:hypothetical protein
VFSPLFGSAFLDGNEKWYAGISWISTQLHTKGGNILCRYGIWWCAKKNRFIVDIVHDYHTPAYFLVVFKNTVFVLFLPKTGTSFVFNIQMSCFQAIFLKDLGQNTLACLIAGTAPIPKFVDT